jgi:uncharacterized oligopeptide transporter (OPT) family protein
VLLGLPALPFALGIYLPLATMAAVFLGGCVRRWCESRPASPAGSQSGLDVQSGILCASGFVAGEGLAGVLIAGREVARQAAGGVATKPTFEFGHELGSLAVLALAAYFLVRSTRRPA